MNQFTQRIEEGLMSKLPSIQRHFQKYPILRQYYQHSRSVPLKRFQNRLTKVIKDYAPKKNY